MMLVEGLIIPMPAIWFWKFDDGGWNSGERFGVVLFFVIGFFDILVYGVHIQLSLIGGTI